MDNGERSLKIASRLVCTDQWLVTHVDPSWSIQYLKQYLLYKFHESPSKASENARSIPVSPRKARRRSLSPITFAAPPPRKPAVVAAPPSSDDSSPSDVSGDVDIEDDVNITKAFTDAHRYKYNTRPSTSSTNDSFSQLPSEGSHDPQAYVLLTFSTTQILEDRFSLDWYGIQPEELLELHPASISFVTLERCSLDGYIAPYFAVRVWALRIVGNKLEAMPITTRPRPGEEDSMADNIKASSTRDKGKRKVAVEWKERWAIIHQGVFSLCKERHDTHAAFTAPLSSMLSIRDSNHVSLPLRTRRLRQKSSTPASSNLVCVKFATASRDRERTFSNDSLSVGFERRVTESHGASPSSSGQGAWWRRGSRDVTTALSLGLTSSANVLVGGGSGTALVDVWDALARKGSKAGSEDTEGEVAWERSRGKGKERATSEDAVWIVLDMLDSAACSHILRVLHRQAPPTCHSTFLPPRSRSNSPAPSPIIFSSRASTPIIPPSPTTPGPSTSFAFPLLSPKSSDRPPLSSTPSSTSTKSYPFPKPLEPLSPASTNTLPAIDTSGIYYGNHGLPYPEWRLSLVRNARRAGLGAVGRAMELVMFGDEDEDVFADIEDAEEDDELAIEWARRNSSLGPSPIEPPSAPIQRQKSRTHMLLPPRHASDPSVLSFTGTDDTDTPRTAPAADYQPSIRSRRKRKSHPLVDLSSLYDAEGDPYPESEKSEAEWVGWVDAVVAKRRQESLLERARARQEALAQSELVPPAGSASGHPMWGTGWSTQFGGSPGSGSPAPSAGTPERESEDAEEGGTWTWRRGSDVDADTEGSSAHSHSSDPNASATSAPRRAGSNRPKHLGRGQAGTGRTLSSYSSVDSLLRRTVTTNIKNINLTQAKRASMHVLFPSASHSDVDLEASVPERAASASPPSSAHLSRPSLASMRSVTSMSGRARPLSPLSSQLPGDYDDEDNGENDIEDVDVDDVEEDHGEGVGYTQSELGHNLRGVHHPVPLPGMRMVPAGYTTFQHSALYGGNTQRQSWGEDRTHAGIVHGQSMQRLPMGMARMMTTVSSTVSVGPSARRGRTR